MNIFNVELISLFRISSLFFNGRTQPESCSLTVSNNCSVKCLTNFFSFLVLQGSPVNIIVGSHVWVEDPALAWIDGQVSRIDGQDVHVQTTNGKRVYA